MTPQAVLDLMGLPADSAMTAAQTATMISQVIIHVGLEFQTTAATVDQATAATTALRVEVSDQLIANAALAAKAAEDLKEAIGDQDFRITHSEADAKESLAKVAANIAQVQSLGAEFHALYAKCEASFDQNTKQATARVLEIQRQVQDLVSRTFQGGDGDGGKGGGGHQPRDRQLFDPRDYKIQDLAASPSLAAFKKWRAEVELFLDTIEEVPV